MFFKNLFGKKTNNTKDWNITDQWLILDGENAGYPMIIRLNTGVKEIVGHPLFPYRIGIAIPLKHPQENGLPIHEEQQYFYQIEEEIYNLFQNNDEAFVCILITTSNFKEYVMYSKTNQKIKQKIHALKSKFPEYDFQHYVQKDKNWDMYKNIDK